MANETDVEHKTLIQQLSDLIEWFLQDRGVELRFVPCPDQNRRISPDYKFQYVLDGRLISERGLAMLIVTEMLRRNYSFNLARVLCALTDHAWNYFVANQSYDDRLLDSPILKRPVGRPRLHPKPIPFPYPENTQPVNSTNNYGDPTEKSSGRIKAAKRAANANRLNTKSSEETISND